MDKQLIWNPGLRVDNTLMEVSGSWLFYYSRMRKKEEKEEKPTERTMKMMKQEHKKVTHEMLKIFTLWGKTRI